jgi:CRP-like cAMP-binding protein
MGLEKFAGALLQTDTAPVSGGPPDLLSALTHEQVSRVFLHARPKTYDRGDMLFSQGEAHDGIYLIESGRVRVFYIAPSGREITLAYWHPGNFVGGPEVFGAGSHIWSGVAATNVAALHLPGAVLRTLAGQIPALAIGLIEGLSFKGKCYSAMAQMLGTRSVTERLAHLLLHLADLYGAPTPRGVLIATKFSHQDLANMVGATRQWVTMSLKRLDQQGVVALGRASITLCRPKALARMRNGDADGALL